MIAEVYLTDQTSFSPLEEKLEATAMNEIQISK